MPDIAPRLHMRILIFNSLYLDMILQLLGVYF